MRNLDGDAFIDSWSRERVPLEKAKLSEDVVVAVPGKVEEELYVIGEYLLRATPGEVNVLRPAEPLPQEEVAIPTDQESWKNFVGEAGSGSATERDPHNLDSWLNAFTGDALRLKGVSLSDVRAINDGFRFVLTVSPEWTIEGVDVLGVESLEPGSYVVTYDGAFKISSLTPAKPGIALFADTATQLTSTTLSVALSNGGLQDVTGATLEIHAAQDGQEPIVVMRSALTLLSETSVVMPVQWAPPREGIWHVTAVIRLPDGRHSDAVPIRLPVAPGETANVNTLLAAASSPMGAGIAVIVLLSSALVAGAFGWRYARMTTIRQAGHGD